MAKDRACARKTDGSSLCPGPASPRDPRDPFAFRILPCLYAPYVQPLPAHTKIHRACPFGALSHDPKHPPIFSGGHFHGCLSIAQLFQIVYLPGAIRQKLCSFVYYLTYSRKSSRPPLVPSFEIWYTFPTKYALEGRDSHGAGIPSRTAFSQHWVIWEKHSYYQLDLSKNSYFVS